ncbi:protein YgfX [Amphritea japonica]|uniref:Toxin CptA n=1 Tax=Amphritea japonica ATCC BAA-1530 TaxID=1278309 RepID=A0A7R6STK1_9GAMM|nr:protein YgfX [Amphritea japonica]BBB27376.1 hypothetical protein AMJAP_2790 [Amphritea japonica ATCC BAA-1530]
MFSPLQVDINPSIYGGGSIVLLVFFSLLSVWVSDLDGIHKLLLSLVSLGYSFFCWSRMVSLTDRFSVIGLRWLVEHQSVVVCVNEGGWVNVDRIEQKFVFPFLIGLRLKLASKKRSVTVLVWRDSTNADDFRKLRVLFRFAPPPVSATHS